MNLGDKPLKDVTLRELLEALLYVGMELDSDTKYRTPKEQVGVARNGAECYLVEQSRYAEAKKAQKPTILGGPIGPVPQWTQQSPTDSGTYWLRREQRGSLSIPGVVQVYQSGSGEWLVAYLGSRDYDAVKGIVGAWWYGPLPVPKFKET